MPARAVTRCKSWFRVLARPRSGELSQHLVGDCCGDVLELAAARRFEVRTSRLQPRCARSPTTPRQLKRDQGKSDHLVGCKYAQLVKIPSSEVNK